MKTKLPDKLSDLIDVALVDLEACEADPRYRIDMDKHWHSPNGKCAVCLAGSVIAQSLGIAPDRAFDPYCVDDEPTMEKLLALNNVRHGLVQLACTRIGHPSCDVPEFTTITPYRHDPTQFKADMRRLSATLREHGL